MAAPRRWQRELSHTWPVLRASGAGDLATSVIRLNGDRKVRLAVDHHGMRHLLIPSDDEKANAAPVEGVLAVRTRTDLFAGTRIRHLDVVCQRADLFDVFDELVCEVLSALEVTSTSSTTTTLEVIERWRTLLTARGARLLTVPRQMALFAELTVLDVITRGSGLDPNWWCGPLREAHDIVGPAAALEVKAIGASSTQVEIHGVQQLEPPAVPLALVLAGTVEAIDGLTVSDLAEAFVDRSLDTARARHLLGQAGWSREDTDAYTVRFVVHELAYVEIKPGVPRVVPGSFTGGEVPPGVLSLNYSITLDALTPHAVRGESELRTWWEAQA